MGDVTTGLFIGGSLQLFVLGVGIASVVLRIDAQLLVPSSCRQHSLSLKVMIPDMLQHNHCTSSSTLVCFDVLGRMTNYFLCTPY